MLGREQLEKDLTLIFCITLGKLLKSSDLPYSPPVPDLQVFEWTGKGHLIPGRSLTSVSVTFDVQLVHWQE